MGFEVSLSRITLTDVTAAIYSRDIPTKRPQNHQRDGDPGEHCQKCRYGVWRQGLDNSAVGSLGDYSNGFRSPNIVGINSLTVG